MVNDVVQRCNNSGNRCGKDVYQGRIITARRDLLLRRISFGRMCWNLRCWTKAEFEQMKETYFAGGGTITYCEPSPDIGR